MEKITVLAVTETQRQGRKGPYTIFNLEYSNAEGNISKASTFKEELGKALTENKGKQLTVDIHANNNGYMEVFAIEGVEVQQRSSGRGKYSPEDLARMDKRDKERQESIERQTALKSADADMNILTTITEIKSEQAFNELKDRRVSWNIKRLQEGK
jgi:hypothetical protein